MRKFLKSGLIALCFVAQPVFANDVMGVWKTEPTDEGSLDIRFTACGSAVCGTIVRARNAAGEEGPYEHLGRKMIWDMQAKADGSWAGGKIWDPRNDRVFNSKMAVNGATLAVSGCVLGVCQSQTWTRSK